MSVVSDEKKRGPLTTAMTRPVSMSIIPAQTVQATRQTKQCEKRERDGSRRMDYLWRADVEG